MEGRKNSLCVENRDTIRPVSRREFENPVEQVMFILGLKHDPRFRTSLEAMKVGANPGIINALEELTVYGAIDANFHGMRATMKVIHADFGSNPPLSVRQSVYEVLVKEMGEKQYGGKWFSTAEKRSEHWISLGAYSPVFRCGGNWVFFRRKGTEVFYLPAPYFRVLSDVFNR